MSESPLSISAFFPCYNDGGTIASMVIEMMRVLRELTDDYEVIVVENGSTDYTNDILDELEALYAADADAGATRLDERLWRSSVTADGRLRIMRYKQPLGYGGALRVGFAAAAKELIFYTDGDAQYDVRELRVLAPRMVDGVDLVMGNKITRHDPLHRIIIGRLYHHLVRLLFNLRIHDTDCDFRLMRRSIFDRVTLTQNSGVICLELMRRVQDAGFSVVEVPVHHYHRAYGVSQFFNLRRLFAVGIGILVLWWRLVIQGEGKEAAPHLPAPVPLVESGKRPPADTGGAQEGTGER